RLWERGGYAVGGETPGGRIGARRGRGGRSQPRPGVGWQEPLERRSWPPVVVANRTPAGGPALAKSRRGCRWLFRSAVTALAARRESGRRSPPTPTARIAERKSTAPRRIAR